MESPEVNAIARILANVDRKRLGYDSVVNLCDLEPQNASYYSEMAKDVIERVTDRRIEAPAEVDEAYERAASRARGNDFEMTNGKDWT